jgi:oxygen-independent coproporphyrinogen-3 oxidase
MGGGGRRAAPQAPGTAFEGPVRHVYVHVPYCRAKCDYCDFASQPVGDAPAPGQLDGFVAGVAAEWERERAAHGVRRLHTLYFGGGTPSMLGPGRLERLLELFRPQLTPRAEVTVEANPEDVDEAFAAWAAAAPAAGGAGAGRGVRVSLGVQSFSAELREALGRRAAADPAAAFSRLRSAGVANLSVDLIHAIPGQSAAALEADIAALLALRPGHVSWYELGLAAGTPLVARVGSGAGAGRAPDAPAPLDDDARAAQYRRIVRALGHAGYGWYEVSNFALPGRRARHNVAYWRARPYLGLGPGAVSTVGARRWTNVAGTAAWAAALAAGARPQREVEDLDAATRARERLLLAARCGAAVPLVEVGSVVDPAAAATLAATGLVSLHSGTIRVTRKGRYVAGAVIVRLFRA